MRLSQLASSGWNGHAPEAAIFVWSDDQPQEAAGGNAMSKRRSNLQSRSFASAEPPESICKATGACSGANSTLTAMRSNARCIKSSSETEKNIGPGMRSSQRHAQYSALDIAMRESPTPRNISPCVFHTSPKEFAILCLHSTTLCSACGLIAAEMVSLAALIELFLHATESAHAAEPADATGSANATESAICCLSCLFGATRHRM